MGTYYHYKVLFSVEVTHTWYDNGYCPDILFSPSDATRDLCRQLQLQVKPTARGFRVLYDETQLPSLLNYLAHNGVWSCLSFVAAAGTSTFNNFTHLPVDMLTRTLYLSNTYAHTDPPDGKIFLHPGRYEKGDKLWQVEGSQVRLPLPDENLKYWVELIAVSGKVLISRPVEGPAAYIDLSAVPEGKYRLQLTEKPGEDDTGELIEEKEFIYINRYEPVLGFIDIFLEDPLGGGSNANFFPVENGKVNAPHYCIGFEGRATRWIYYIMFLLQQSGNGLFIQSKNNPYEYQGPEEVDIGAGVIAWRFISAKPIPLKQRSPFVFRLMNGGGPIGPAKGRAVDAEPVELVNRLPVAGVAQVLPEKDGVFSAIYVTI